jgi:hypothetical protein
MKELKLVSPAQVHRVWEQVNQYFEASYEASTKDCTVDQLRMLLAQGAQALFVIEEDSKIVGAFSVQIATYPNCTVAMTTGMGGKDVFSEETIAQYESWAKSQGVTKIKAYAQEAQARLYRQKLGLKTTAYVVEKEI